MDEALLEAYRTTRYLVCLDGIDWAELRINQPLPGAVQAIVGEHDWGFITAWNPLSLPREETLNLSAQRSLASSLKDLPDSRVLPAIGIGSNGWSEPSFFVTGSSTSVLDILASEYRQNAYVYGQGASPAQLRMLRR